MSDLITARADARVAALDSLGLHDERVDKRFDRVLEMVSEFFQLPYAVVVLAGRNELIAKAQFGFDVPQTALHGSITEAVMSSDETFVISDARQTPRFGHSASAVPGLTLRSLIGHRLRSPGGEVIGAFLMFGPEVRNFSDKTRTHFRLVASWLEDELSRETEERRAIEVQKALQPQQAVALRGYELAAASTPARAVSGDFFDWYPVPGGLGLTLGDVMGKSYGAAIIAASIKGVLRSSAQDYGVRKTMERASRLLEEDLSRTNSFATVFHANLRESDGRIRYVDAGHGLTLIVRANGDHTRLAHTDLPLGSTFEHRWHRHTIQLFEGDTLISFTDGILDLFDGSFDSLEDVAMVVRLADSAASAVASLTALAEYDRDTDDVAVLAIRRLSL